MAIGFRISLDNHLPAATLTPSSEASGYLASNLRLITELDLPWKTTATGEQYLVIDHGAAKSIGRWAILATNYTQVWVQANTANDWPMPLFDPYVFGGGVFLVDGVAYSYAATIGTNLGNGRLCAFHIPASAQSYRYNRIFIPSQPTTDGASYYRTGVVTAGPLASPPRGLRFEWDTEDVEPVDDKFTVSRRRQRSYMGPVQFSMKARRQAVGDVGSGATQIDRIHDEIKSFLALDRAWKAKDVAVVSFLDSDTSWVHVARILSTSRWTHGVPAESDIEIEEVA